MMHRLEERRCLPGGGNPESGRPEACLAARVNADGPGMCTGAYPESGNRLHSGWESSVLTDASWIGGQPVGTPSSRFAGAHTLTGVGTFVPCL